MLAHAEQKQDFRDSSSKTKSLCSPAYPDSSHPQANSTLVISPIPHEYKAGVRARTPVGACFNLTAAVEPARPLSKGLAAPLSTCSDHTPAPPYSQPYRAFELPPHLILPTNLRRTCEWSARLLSHVTALRGWPPTGLCEMQGPAQHWAHLQACTYKHECERWHRCTLECNPIHAFKKACTTPHIDPPHPIPPLHCSPHSICDASRRSPCPAPSPPRPRPIPALPRLVPAPAQPPSHRGTPQLGCPAAHMPHSVSGACHHCTDNTKTRLTAV